MEDKLELIEEKIDGIVEKIAKDKNNSEYATYITKMLTKAYWEIDFLESRLELIKTRTQKLKNPEHLNNILPETTKENYLRLFDEVDEIVCKMFAESCFKNIGDYYDKESIEGLLDHCIRWYKNDLEYNFRLDTEKRNETADKIIKLGDNLLFEDLKEFYRKSKIINKSASNNVPAESIFFKSLLEMGPMDENILSYTLDDIYADHCDIFFYGVMKYMIEPKAKLISNNSKKEKFLNYCESNLEDIKTRTLASGADIDKIEESLDSKNSSLGDE